MLALIDEHPYGSATPYIVPGNKEASYLYNVMLPPNQRLVPIFELSSDARANLKWCLADGGFDGASVDVPASSEAALEDMRTIIRELQFLPPLIPPEDTEQFREELERASRKGLFSICDDASGLVASPAPDAIRNILRSSEYPVARAVFQRLTDITRKPAGSAAPGSSEGPPARVTIRFLKASTASTLGEPKHTDGKPAKPLESGGGEGLVRRPRLIWTFDTKNPLRVISWRARACIETEAACVGGGISASERVRCDPPFLHEGMTTDLSGAPIGPRLQLVTDPDWFNAPEAVKLF